VVALLIDGLLLAIVGQLVGLLFAEPLYMAGSYGRWIGLLLVLAYFGLGTSAIAGGQTLAMRLFGIAVRSNDGAPIDLPRALTRSLVFVAPIMAAGLTALGVRGSPPATAAQAILVLGLGLGGIAFAIGNRRRCQALHDVLCSTQVVRLSAAPVAAYEGTPRRILTNVLPMAFALTLLAASSLALGAAVRSGNDELRDLERELAQDPRVVEVSASFASSQAGPAAKWVELDVWHRGSITEEQRADLTADLAQATFARIEDIDAVQVTIAQGFDIGIARRGASWTSAIAAANQP
jgi:uncharacterized RDD family membrane protein YckC